MDWQAPWEDMAQLREINLKLQERLLHIEQERDMFREQRNSLEQESNQKNARIFRLETRVKELEAELKGEARPPTPTKKRVRDSSLASSNGSAESLFNPQSEVPEMKSCQSSSSQNSSSRGRRTKIRKRKRKRQVELCLTTLASKKAKIEKLR